jgi:hypothetical protein
VCGRHWHYCGVGLMMVELEGIIIIIVNSSNLPFPAHYV